MLEPRASVDPLEHVNQRVVTSCAAEKDCDGLTGILIMPSTSSFPEGASTERMPSLARVNPLPVFNVGDKVFVRKKLLNDRVLVKSGVRSVVAMLAKRFKRMLPIAMHPL